MRRHTFGGATPTSSLYSRREWERGRRDWPSARVRQFHVVGRARKHATVFVLFAASTPNSHPQPLRGNPPFAEIGNVPHIWCCTLCCSSWINSDSCSRRLRQLLWWTLSLPLSPILVCWWTQSHPRLRILKSPHMKWKIYPGTFTKINEVVRGGSVIICGSKSTCSSARRLLPYIIEGNGSVATPKAESRLS